MFRFEEAQYFELLIVLVVFVAIYYAYRWWRKKQWSRFATTEAADRLRSTRSAVRETIRVILVFTGLIFLVIAFTNPQWGFRKEKVKQTSADLYLALDISSSMLAEDVAPSRLERAKYIASQLAESFKSDRLALILFAGNAYLQTPLTSDFAAVQMFIRAAHPGQAATQGTSFGEAIDLVLRAHREEKTTRLAMVFLTDGENHDQEAIEKMKEARDAGIVPFIIAIGSEQGATIPTIRSGNKDVKRDRQGNPVVSKLNTTFLKALTDAGGGEVFPYQEADKIISELKQRITGLEKLEMEARSFSDYRSYFQYFLFFALCCFIAEHLIGERSAGTKFMSVFKWK